MFSSGSLSSDTSNQEYSKFETAYKLQEKFFENFAQSVVIFDPIDRKMLNDDEINQTIPRDELVKKIEMEVKRVKGANLKLPIDPVRYKKILKMFDDCEQECIQLSEHFIEKIQNQE